MRKQSGIIAIIILAVLTSHTVWSDHEEDNWIEPNRWTLEDIDFVSQYPKQEHFDKCLTSEPNDNTVALMYYKKFIGHLFSRKKLKYDKITKLFTRTVAFTLLPEQLEKLEHLSDPRDLDIVLTEIFTNARSIVHLMDGKIITDHSSFLSLICDIVKDVWQILKISEVRFLLWVASAILVGWFINWRYGIGIIKMITVCFLLFGYLYTYVECNRKIEVEKMLEILENEQGQPATTSWFNFWPFDSSKKDNRHNKIKKAAQINLPFCRPDHVFIIYLNELILKQLELFLDKCTDTVISLKNNLTFPFNYIAGIMMIILIAYILKLTFENILRPSMWTPLFHHSTSNPAPNLHTSHAQVIHGNTGSAAITEDRVSGENLKLLLNALNVNTPLNQQQTPVSAIESSGVQELNALNEKLNDSNSSNKSTESQNSTDNNVDFKPSSKKPIESNETVIPQQKQPQQHDASHKARDSEA